MIRTQEQSFNGQVSQYLLNGEGEVDGLMLTNGNQVLFPPHLGTELTAIIQPNASVVIQGQIESANVVRAFAITNQSTGQTVVDGGPPRHAPPPPRHAPLPPPPEPLHRRREALLAPMSASGRVVALLNGPAGDTNGFILADKTIVRLKPHDAFGLSITNNVEVNVQGYGLENPYGRCIEATTVQPISQISTYNGSSV